MTENVEPDPNDTVELDFPWTEAPVLDEEPSPVASRWAKPGNSGDGAEAKTMPPFLDQEIADEDVNAPPVWFGKRWREITGRSEKREAWIHLRGWVMWLKTEYKIVDLELPNCWFLHTDVTAELYAAQCAEYKAWEEGAPGLTPFTTWHPHLVALRGRLKGQSTAKCVREKRHNEEEGSNGLAPFALVHDEEQWQKHINTYVEEQLIPIHRGVTGYRLAVTDSDGVTSYSDDVSVSDALADSKVQLSTIKPVHAGERGERTLNVSVTGEELATSWWETQLPGSDIWVVMPTTKVRLNDTP